MGAQEDSFESKEGITVNYDMLDTQTDWDQQNKKSDYQSEIDKLIPKTDYQKELDRMNQTNEDILRPKKADDIDELDDLILNHFWRNK